jgi:hypothetical protein
MTIGRATYQPGWRWSEHVGASTGATHCTVEACRSRAVGTRHRGDAGRTIHDSHRRTLFYIPSEPHDSWVVGDEPYVSLYFAGAAVYAKK